MQPISWFRGAGGEMVRIYVSPLSYLSAIPIAVLVLVIAAGLGAMGENGIYLSAPTLFFFYVLAIMRVAIPASRGKLDPSNDFGELLSYSCRYVAVTLAGMVPVVAAVAAIVRFGGDKLASGGVSDPIEPHRRRLPRNRSAPAYDRRRVSTDTFASGRTSTRLAG